MFKAKDIMSQDVVTVSPDDTTDHAISLLVEHKISGLPVVDREGCLVGVITEFDLLELIYNGPADEEQVCGYMSTDVKKVTEDANWVEVGDMFRSTPMRRLPVTRGNKLVGIVARHDLMRAIHDIRQRVRKERAACC